MACPFFEPTQVCDHPAHPGARLPLVREHAGLCHASGLAMAVPADRQFASCNQGYSRAECPFFPSEETVSCVRYTVRGETSETLRIMCIEECEHTPVRWYEVQFEIASGTVAGEMSAVVRAQAEAFGRSYLACATSR